MAQIKKDTSLRKAILQAAITGQLISDIGGECLPLAAAGKPSSATPSAGTPRNAPTETGKQLLDRIIEERNKKLLAEWEEALKKNPKAKKPAPIAASEIDEDEIPFEIPENWCWCRLGDVIDVRDGTHDTPSYTLSGYPLITGKDFYNGYFDLSKTQYVSQTDYELIISRSKVDVDDILFSMIGGNIGSLIHITKENYFDMAIKNVALFKQYNYDLSLAAYLEIFLRSQTTNFKDIAKGGAQTFISLKMLRDCYYPLPPLSVQNAIVAKLEQVLPLVDAYENAVLQKEELKSTLSDKVKKAILQEAITGKLTEEWRSRNKFGMTDNCHAELVSASQETGKQLLDRIIKERNAKALAEWEEKLKTNPKAKKPEPVVASEIEEEDVPFEIPESWCWCHLGEICNEIKRGKSPKYVDRSDYLAFAQKCNVKTGGIDLGLSLYLDEKTIDRYSEDDNLIQGDVVINSTGGGTMGRVGYYETKVPDGIKGVYPDSHVTVIRSIGKINQRYLYYVLKHNQPILEDCGTGSTNQTELKPGVLANFVIPLPPLEEQKEIVKKVEELLELCK